MPRHADTLLWLKPLLAAALLPLVATCSQSRAEPAAQALTPEQLRAEAGLVAFLIDGAGR